MKKIEIRFINHNFMYDMRKAALNTSGKRDTASTDMPLELFRKYLISEHSPIRAAILEVLFVEISYPSSVHFARHVHSIPFVKSSRPDITGKERSLDNPVDHLAHWNLQALIDMMRKRLCVGKVSKETYEWARDLKLALMQSESDYLRIVGEVVVPNCIYRMGCPEFKSCRSFEHFLYDLDLFDIRNIADRYKLFNDFYFYKEK